MDSHPYRFMVNILKWMNIEVANFQNVGLAIE